MLCGKHSNFLYPRYEVYRGNRFCRFCNCLRLYVCFLFVCLSVCLSVNFFLSKISKQLTILKFDAKLDSDELYCKTKQNSHILLISPFICSFFSFFPMEISSHISKLLLEPVF